MTNVTNTMRVRPLTGYLGAEITGIDLAKLSAFEVKAVRKAFLEHQVVFFKHQKLGADDFAALAEKFGEIDPPHSGLLPHPDNAKVMMTVSRKGEGGAKYNDIWHSDVSFDETPPLGSLLHPMTLPPVGGDTVWASMYAAYEKLSDRIKTLIEGLEVLHDGIPTFTRFLLDPAIPNGAERLRKMKVEKPGCVHPLVIRHPETGRRALFISRAYAACIVGLPELESRHLINMLCEHCEQANFQVRWRWSEGDVAFWDNRCTIHYATKDYGLETREIMRVTLKGTRPMAA